METVAHLRILASRAGGAFDERMSELAATLIRAAFEREAAALNLSAQEGAASAAAEDTPPRPAPKPPPLFRLPPAVPDVPGAKAVARALFQEQQCMLPADPAEAVVRLQAASRSLLARKAAARRRVQAALLVQAAARGLLARAALRTYWQGVAQLLELARERVRKARKRYKRQRERKARVARLHAESEQRELDVAAASAARELVARSIAAAISSSPVTV